MNLRNVALFYDLTSVEICSTWYNVARNTFPFFHMKNSENKLIEIHTDANLNNAKLVDLDKLEAAAKAAAHIFKREEEERSSHGTALAGR